MVAFKILVPLIFFACQPFIVVAQTMPEVAVIENVSDRLELKIKENQPGLELSSLYVPSETFPVTLQKVREVAVGNEFGIIYIGKNSNRHGNFSATITKTGDRKSLQEHLLENGLALAYFTEPFDNKKFLFIAENKAINSKSGFWKDFAIIDSNSIEKDHKNWLGKFVIIEGKVSGSYRSNKGAFINFGNDWKTDFTIQIENKTLKTSPEFSIEKLTNKKLRVRGWLENYNGPFIKIFNLENIEVLQ